jgi:multimeric flavodoxin WrbA
MKVVAFNGSNRKDGNTAILVRHIFAELEKESIETRMIQLAGREIRGCLACYKCYVNADKRCVQEKDVLNEYIQEMASADGMILASPVYVASISPALKALIDRATMVGKANGGLFRHKVGAAVVAVRRGGQVSALDTINHFFLLSEMMVPGSSYWNFAFGLEKGDVDRDAEGIQTMNVLGQNMAWLLKKLNG